MSAAADYRAIEATAVNFDSLMSDATERGHLVITGPSLRRAASDRASQLLSALATELHGGRSPLSLPDVRRLMMDLAKFQAQVVASIESSFLSSAAGGNRML